MRWRLKVIVFVAVAGLSEALAMAQAGQIGPSEFEVASIRPSGPSSPRGSIGGPGSKSPDRYSFYSATLFDLIVIAWDVQNFQVSSRLPLDRDRFDLTAKIPDGATKKQFREMLQNLLAERFNLKAHVETREFPAYALCVDKSGFRLKDADQEVTPQTTDANRSFSTGNGDGKGAAALMAPNIVFRHSVVGGFELVQIDAHLEPISTFVRYLPQPDNLPVVDETGLNGKYSFTLEYSQELPGAESGAPPSAPEIFTALQEQLGLQLKKTVSPFEVVTIDSINRLPTEN